MKAHPTNPPTIVLGVTGSIAAYKAAELTSKLCQANFQVQVIMTECAIQLIQPQTFFTLSKQPVITSLWTATSWQPTHIALAEKSSLFAVVPASADIMAKMAHGIADDALTTYAISHTGPIIVFPAMNPRMWANAATQENVETLRRRGIVVIDPLVGHVACGESGRGRLPEVPQIFNYIVTTMKLNDFVQPPLNALIAASSNPSNETFQWHPKFSPLTTPLPIGATRNQFRVVITAGPTREPIDPVRFISNKSTGKMGFALAAAAASVGFQVSLVAGPVDIPDPLSVNRINVVTGAEMKDAVMSELFPSDPSIKPADLIISAAAVEDFKPASVAEHKIHKDGEMDIHINQTDDILFCVHQAYVEKQTNYNSLSGQLRIVGFAAETDNIKESALHKMEKKGLDMIISNDVSRKDIGFASNENEVIIYQRDSDPIMVPKQSKHLVASEIFKHIIKRYFAANSC